MLIWPAQVQRGFWVKQLESLYGETIAQNLISIAKMAAVVFQPYDWLRPKNRPGDVTSDKISVLYGRGKPKMATVLFEPYDWTMAALSK